MEIDRQDLVSGYSLSIYLAWLKELLDARMAHYFESAGDSEFEPPAKPSLREAGPIDSLIDEHNMSWAETAVLLLSIAPYVRPQLLDIFLTDNPNLNRGFTEFGGIRNRETGGFIPTGETALFVVAGADLTHRVEAMRMFQGDHFFYTDQLLSRPDAGANGPEASAALAPTQTCLHRLLWNEAHRPEYQAGFPANRVSTKLDWDDLVLSKNVLAQVNEIRSWMEHQTQIKEEWGLDKLIKPGYRSLFFGPPGTGKTLTAGLLGKALEMDVYRIDLSMVVSKYIGETEKNLASVFDYAVNRDWILFFDEADALFGKRTQTQSSHDRYANQEVSYLLQRIEDFSGVVILASNFKGNLDEAFTRRFQSMVHFPMPGRAQRLQLWKAAFSYGLPLDSDVDLEAIAEDHEISGGEIVNVIRTAAIRVASRGERAVNGDDLVAAIKKELQKDGRLLGNSLGGV